MSHRTVFSARERALTVESLLAEGRTKEASELAARALTARLGAPLPAALQNALKACQDTARLGALVELAAGARTQSDEELVAGALAVLERGRPRSDRRRRRSTSGKVTKRKR